MNAGTASGSFDFTGAAIGAHYDAPTRTNLIINPSFEIDLTGWTASGTGFTLDRTTDQAASGTTSMRLTSTISAGTFGVVHDQVTVTPSVDFTLQAKFRGFSIARTCRVRLLWYDNTSTFIRTDTSSGTDTTTGFTTVSLTSTAPANAAYVKPQVQVSMNVLGDVHYVDAVLLEQSSTVGTYFDGDTTDDSTHVYDWTGTPGASTSTEAPASRNGTTTSTFDFTGATSGAAPNRGTATGSFDFTATAAGATGHLGTSSGAFDFTGSATGSKLCRGSSTAGFDFTGTAVGETPPNVGTSTGAYDFTGSAAGDVAHNATAVGTYDETGSSIGATPTWQPHNLIATAVSGSQIDLTWDALDYATAYDIERDGSIIAYDVATNSYSDTGLTAETLYTYRVRAVQ